MAGTAASRFSGSAGVESIAALAEAADVRLCLQWFAARKRWIDAKHLELCRIPALTFQEERRAEWMAAELRALGWKTHIDPAGNVIAGEASREAAASIALTAHLDTVLAPRKPEEVTVGNRGRLEGPGVADNGAGLAALLAIAAVLKEHPLFRNQHPRLLLIANVGEEGEGNLSGMRYLCNQSELADRIGTFLVLDGPSTASITNRALASRRLEVTFEGSGGHSWSAHGVANPIHALSRAITLFCDERERLAKTPEETACERSSFNFGIFEGGISVNSIPTLARAKVDLRSEGPLQIDEMATLLKVSVGKALETMERNSPPGKLTARIREIGSRPGGVLPEDAPVLRCIKTVDAYLGIRSRLDCASTDANIPLSMGRQAVSIGAGGKGGGAHTPGEWFEPAGRELGLKRILLLLCLLLRAAGCREAPEGN